LSDDDLVATATALTAVTIADGYELAGTAYRPEECIVSGGGARNPALMQMLAERLAPIPVTDLSALGWDPDAKEAAAFAILAHLCRAGRPGNLPSVTGAKGPRILGRVTPP
jgi:anhydro-N-acetylmuramic acid kinase